jgi:flavin-binding protein dodecin
MPRNALCRNFARLLAAAAVAFFAAASGISRASDSADSISGSDVDGRPVAINGKGHYTVVMYTNPDLEDESRAMTLALDPYRGRSDFDFVRVVDLRGDVPASMRSMVRGQIRKEQAKESARLKKAGVAYSAGTAPIIPDFSGSTLDALGWSDTYDEVHLVVYDTHGREIKRLASVTDAKQMTKVVDSIL